MTRFCCLCWYPSLCSHCHTWVDSWKHRQTVITPPLSTAVTSLWFVCTSCRIPYLRRQMWKTHDFHNKRLRTDNGTQINKELLLKQEFVRPRWPYDMRPSVRAEKFVTVSVTLAVDEKTLPMATITGRTDRGTDRQTDRQSATQYAAPPREEGRIITLAGPVAYDLQSNSQCITDMLSELYRWGQLSKRF